MKGSKSILLAEDDEQLSHALQTKLEEAGYKVVTCKTGKSATNILDENFFDFLILDVSLPQINGYEVCKHFRQKDNVTPVIFIAADNATAARIAGLRAGADDYIGKPVNMDELLLKINRLILRNDRHLTHEVVHFGNCWIDFTTFEAKGANGKKIRMSKLEFDLARLLINNESKPLSRNFLYERLWGYDSGNPPNSRTLDNFIVFLRKYFEENQRSPRHFVSVRGVGYKFIKNKQA